jgi:hypothetical protein
MLYMHRSKNRQVDDAKKRRYCSCWDKKEGRESREKSRSKAELNVKERPHCRPIGIRLDIHALGCTPHYDDVHLHR